MMSKRINVIMHEQTEDGLVVKHPQTNTKMVEGLAGELNFKADKDKVSQEFDDVNNVIKKNEFSELTSIAQDKEDAVYKNVVWTEKDGSIYAKSVFDDNILTVTYTQDNKVIKWKIYTDDDGFPYKKELI